MHANDIYNVLNVIASWPWLGAREKIPGEIKFAFLASPRSPIRVLFLYFIKRALFVLALVFFFFRQLLHSALRATFCMATGCAAGMRCRACRADRVWRPVGNQNNNI